MTQADIGVLGLGMMGRNLALNIADRGFSVVGYERDPALLTQAMATAEGLIVHGELERFVASIKRPRALLLMITAGAPVDQSIKALLPLLSPGDVLVDAGNSDYQDTGRREALLRQARIGYLGLGVSGGEEGARHGPALMAGGAWAAYARVAPVLTAIAARADD